VYEPRPTRVEGPRPEIRRYEGDTVPQAPLVAARGADRGRPPVPGGSVPLPPPPLPRL